LLHLLVEFKRRFSLDTLAIDMTEIGEHCMRRFGGMAPIETQVD